MSRPLGVSTAPPWRRPSARRTRLVVLNNPLNPTATVAAEEDLALLAEFCVRHDAIAICDEVWEEIVFSPTAIYP